VDFRMKKENILHRGDRGYILLMVVVMMLVMAVMAFGMNRRAGMRAKMAANQTRSSQTHLGQIAALEEAAWILNRNPTWRTSAAGEKYVFAGIEYKRFVLDASGYSDVVTVTVTAPDGLKRLSSSFRLLTPTVTYYLIADTDNNVIRRVDTSTGVITTFAGTGSDGYSGDGGPAISARLRKPRGVFADQAGNIYIADTDNHRVRMVDAATEIITLVAGNGNDNYEETQDEGVAPTSAHLKKPRGVYVDATGNIYIADTDNCMIRKVDVSTNKIYRVAGATDGKDPLCGWSGDGGLATNTRLDKPRGVWVDASGNIYIADTENNRIRMVDATTQMITTIAGNGGSGYTGDDGPATAAELHKPNGVLVDVSGNIYIADTDNDVIRMVDATTQFIYTIAGTGSGGYSGDDVPATSTSLHKPRGLWLDASGNILIADADNHRARLVYDDGGTLMITTVAGDGSSGYSGDDGQATSASLRKPHGVCIYEALPPAYLAIADPSNHRIREVNLNTGIITKVAGTLWSGYNGDNIDATSARLYYPFGVHVDSSHNTYIADTYNHRIRKVDGKTGIITTVAGYGSKGFSGDGGPATSARLRYPFNLYLDTVGNIYIMDTYNYRIRKVDAATKIITTVVGNGAAKFTGDGGLATDASIRKAYDVAVDNAGNLFIADTHNHVIRKVDAATGIINTVVGQGFIAGFSGDGGLATDAKLNAPTGVYVDESGNIYVVDTKNDVVRKVDATTNIINTVAGNGTPGFSGDGGLATLAQLDYPEAVWVDSGGNMFIVDTDNCRIRRVDGTSGIITTVAGTTYCGYNGNNQPATDAALYYPSEVSVYEPSSLERMPEIYRPTN
jgi:streptogramin lyase